MSETTTTTEPQQSVPPLGEQLETDTATQRAAQTEAKSAPSAEAVPPALADRKPEAEEVMDSLNGHEEQMILDVFGTDVVLLAARRPASWMRALAYVLLHRKGAPLAEARSAVMAMRMQQVADLFADPSSSGDDELPGGDAEGNPAG